VDVPGIHAEARFFAVSAVPPAVGASSTADVSSTACVFNISGVPAVAGACCCVVPAVAGAMLLLASYFIRFSSKKSPLMQAKVRNETK
jgi:hypothetical protein